MRLAHDYVVASGDGPSRAERDRNPEEFAETMGYREGRFRTREDLLEHARTRWVAELHDVLGELLSRERSILSLGSGYCEHEVPFALAGYRIVATDIVEDALADAGRLFPELTVRRFDVLAPDLQERFDDVLVAGLDFALDDDELRKALLNLRSVLEPGGRVIFVLRYHDNLATRLIDGLMRPAIAHATRVRARLSGRRLAVLRREHGFRRRRSEVRRLAAETGYRVGRVRHAAFALELERIDLHRRLPALYRLAQRVDRRLAVFNSATVFELLTENPR
ncbi:MAG: class I SAM-dependent methyltransferase [Thermoleophilaceae bacterium]